MRTLLLSLVALAPGAALAAGPSSPVASKLTVTSTAFKASEAIPPELTCDGGSRTPPLAWSAVPRGTRSIAILVDDPDAPQGTFTHWLITGLPPTTTGIAKGGALPAGAVVARNSSGGEGYTGPCPPHGRHRYVFHVYALDTQLKPPASKQELLTAMAGHVIASGELVGTYTRINTNE